MSENNIVSNIQGNQIEKIISNFHGNLSQDSQKDMDILLNRMREHFPKLSNPERKISDIDNITTFLYNNIPSSFYDNTKKEFIQMLNNMRNVLDLPPIPTSIKNDTVSNTQGNQMEEIIRNFEDNLSKNNKKNMDILFGRMNEQFPKLSNSGRKISDIDNITTFLYKNIPLSFDDNTKKEFIQMLNNLRNVVNLPPVFTSIISSIKKVLSSPPIKNDTVSESQTKQINNLFEVFQTKYLPKDSEQEKNLGGLFFSFIMIYGSSPETKKNISTKIYYNDMTIFFYKSIPKSFDDNTKKEFIQMLSNIRNVLDLPPLFTSIISSIKKVITTSSSSIKKVLSSSLIKKDIVSSIKKVLSSSSNQNVPTPSSNIKYYLIIVLIILLAIAYFFIKKK